MTKKTTSFSHIWTLIQQIDRITCRFLFKDVPKSKIEKFQSLILPLHVTLVLVFNTSTLYISDFSFLSIIICVSVSIAICTVYYMLFIFHHNKALIKSYFDWFGNFNELLEQETYCAVLGSKDHLLQWRILIVKVVTGIRNTFMFLSIFMTFGSILFSLILPDSIYPKYTLPVPFILPFKNQKTWIAYITTAILQTFVATFVLMYLSLFFEVLCALFIHLIGLLDVVKQLVIKLNDHLQYDSSQNKNQQHGSLDPSLLDEISSSCHQHLYELDDWLVMITDLLCYINDKITLMSSILSHYFIIMEVAVSASLLAAGMILMVVQQQQPFAIFCYFSSSFLFCFCLINEKILEKYQEISNEFYDIPWYDLASKDRRKILIVMNCDKIQTGFVADGMHKLTLDRFATIVKIAYSNCLILKDIVQKMD